MGLNGGVGESGGAAHGAGTESELEQAVRTHRGSEQWFTNERWTVWIVSHY